MRIIDADDSIFEERLRRILLNPLILNSLLRKMAND